ncbi:class I SAM-dependent methyltransferase [Sedimentitalea todarodis]|uniref:Class I SAM-dependent methyltransferase n=1 Tax=Sedimentitalea todarodis TaxID=1631240 RepID=A0ABU3V897_9RHOB|nr:class I SAM-dependent methyltransferase [Sedimentitalea todarodis]MDU9002392.1 class I SAM-dependent methyltransferase [Sedimentitalea todarodis]
MKSNGVIDGYAAVAESLIARYEALSCEEIYQHVMDMFPQAPARIIDIGAGTGRDAGWLAARGYTVTAVEPVPAFRAAARQLHAGKGIVCVDDRLPALASVRSMGEQFDVLLLGGVWHHLPVTEQDTAWVALADLMAPGAVAILSLRHGPGVPGRPAFEVDDDRLARSAGRQGLFEVRRVPADSIQAGNRAAAVSWTWLVLQMKRAGSP